MRSVAVGLLLVILVLQGCGAQVNFQQQSSPLRGQGVPGANVSDGIYLSVFLDRLLEVDQEKYRFDAILYAYVTWVDQAGVGQWFKNNIANNCADPAREDYNDTWCSQFQNLCERYQNATNSTQKAATAAEGAAFLGTPIDVPCQSFNSDGSPVQTTCTRHCSNLYNSNDCCDGIFIPDLQIANIYSLNQDFTFASQLMPQYDYRQEHYGAWMWSVQFHAQFHTRMNFRKFPYDSHQLVMQVKYLHDSEASNKTSILYPSSAGVLSLRPRFGGDDTSGWNVKRVYMQDFIKPPDSLIRDLQGEVVLPNPNDPVPLFTTATDSTGRRRVTGLEPVFDRRLNPGNSLLVIIEVSRFVSFYIVNNLVPIILSTALSFFVFLIPADDMEKRLTLLVTLFLALTALQFVINTNLPDSSYVLKTQALVLTGYCMFIAMGLESWLVCHISTLHAKYVRHKARKSAWQRARGLQSTVEAPEMPSPTSAAAAAAVAKANSRAEEDSESTAAPGDEEQGSIGAGNGVRLAPASAAARRKHLQRLGAMRLGPKFAPARTDPDYAEWLSGKIDRWSCMALVVGYVVVLIVVLTVG